MAERIDDTSGIESTTIGVFRTAATVKGGRRFSFSSMVVVGDRNGSFGFGYGKANQVPPAIEKAQKEAKRRMRHYPLQGRTLPHVVEGKFGACTVRLLPASPGTGVIAGAAVRAPLEMLGVRDCLTKCFGSTNAKNLVKAVFNGLDQLRAKTLVEELRGLEVGKSAVEESIERTRGSFTETIITAAPRAAAPEARGGERKGKQRGPAGGRSRRRGGRDEAAGVSGDADAAS
jgi:small subunit ribosomal protein S5